MILIFLGAPGSGKGTQAKRLLSDRKWPQLSTGDMFRAAIKDGTPIGLKAKSFMDAGNLVPDDVVVGVVEERIKASDCAAGFILDGFPRTIPQAEALDRMLVRAGRKVDRVIQFEVPEVELVERLTGRRTCSKCGAVFHVKANPPKVEGICDVCGAKALIQRDDDKLEVVQNRFNVYRQQTAPLVDYYGRSGNLRAVNAFQHPDRVYEALLKNLN